MIMMSVMIIMIMRMILVALYNQYVGVEEEGVIGIIRNQDGEDGQV